jgi:chemotaxis protein CheX
MSETSNLKLDCIDPFVRAGFSVLETLLKARPGRGPLAMRTSTSTTQQLTIMMKVSGDAQGVVLYGMSLVAAQKIASTMLDRPVTELDDAAWEAINQLARTINENAMRLLGEAGYKCEISPAEIVRGVNVAVSTEVPALVVPISTRFGRLEIDIALSMSDEARKAA